jgi:hypothetical protein
MHMYRLTIKGRWDNVTAKDVRCLRLHTYNLNLIKLHLFLASHRFYAI